MGINKLAAGVALVAVVTVSALVAPAAQAVKPVGDCPGEQWLSTTIPTDVDDTASDLWQLTLAGLEAEFGSLDAALPAFGLSSLEELVELVIAGASAYDKNGDGTLCLMALPHTRGNPAYKFNAVDNTARR